MLGGDLRNDLVLALFKVDFATDGSVPACMDWTDSAEIVSGLAALFLHDKMKAEPVLALEASKIPCVQLKSESAFGTVQDFHA